MSFVFADPGGRRWRTLRLVLLVCAGVVGLLLAGLGVSVAFRPALPGLALLDTAPAQERRTFMERVHPGTPVAAFAPALPAAHGTRGAPEVTGFYVNWDDNSFSSLRQHLSSLTELDPEALHFTDAGLLPDDPVKTANLLAFLHAQPGRGVRLVPLVNNYDNRTQAWQSAPLARMLRSVDERRALEDHLLRYVRQVGGAGLMIDFEQVPADVQPQYVAFLHELHARTRANGWRLNVALPLDDDNYPYAQLGAAVDRVHLMAYDEHDDGGAPGPVAAQGWLQDTLQARLAQLPAGEVVLDVGNYGYDWGAHGGSTLSYQDAVTQAQSAGVSPHLDAGSLNPTYTYRAADGAHTVWYLDAVSTFDSVQAARRLGVNQVALWRMGTEDPRVWRVLNRTALGTPGLLGQDVVGALRPLPYGYDLAYRGRGELLRVVSQPRDGLRALTFEAGRGLVTGERTVRPASPFVIGRWGSTHPRDIAITFDDGPDPTWTPKLLDILHAAQAPATFFVVGLQAQQYPGLVRQEVARGMRSARTRSRTRTSAWSPPPRCGWSWTRRSACCRASWGAARCSSGRRSRRTWSRPRRSRRACCSRRAPWGTRRSGWASTRRTGRSPARTRSCGPCCSRCRTGRVRWCCCTTRAGTARRRWRPCRASSVSCAPTGTGW
ncbi:hypothetical protein GCM10008939_21630 [Deinococcus aquiradiocola]|uniref:Polysaccharide deacetylase n=1 Tax=Deinococcus aquiradiocola TaxID=393059 RepID=A0A917PH87_9DEIO|nr:hypothetical protein GCM10008939_21630 [Deinococcus aquiradiocola]